ncbi:MAG: glutaredoxin family protein [Gallionellaceae bacterium]|jgi:hypothetical protein
MKKILCLVTFMLLAVNIQASEYFRSIDKTGQVEYGDKPLSNAVEVEKLKARTTPPPNKPLPYATQRAMAKFPVTLYVAENCGQACILARAYLTKRNIPFVEKNLVNNSDIEAFKTASSGEMIPTLNIGKNWLKGYLESQWEGELDAAGYPRAEP